MPYNFQGVHSRFDADFKYITLKGGTWRWSRPLQEFQKCYLGLRIAECVQFRTFARGKFVGCEQLLIGPHYVRHCSSLLAFGYTQ